MTINLKPTKETRLILRAYLVPTSVPVKAESWFLKTACRILHTGICYMSRQKIQLWLRGPAVFSGAGFFSVMLGNGTDANCSFRQCFVSCVSWERWTRATLLPLKRIFCFAPTSLPSGRAISALFPGDALCLSFSGSDSEQPCFLHNHMTIS